MENIGAISLIALGYFFQFLDILIWARVILSLVVMFMGKQLKIYDIVCMFTEPLLAPIRALLNKSDFLNNSPFDFSVLVLWLLISFVKQLLGV